METFISAESNLGSNLSHKCVKKYFGEFYQINGIESSPNIGSIKLRTNTKHTVYVTNVTLLIRSITRFENRQQKTQKQENHENGRCHKDFNVYFSYIDIHRKTRNKN